MKIGVLSDGAWGTALAITLVQNGHDVVQWGPFPDYLLEMRERRENVRYLPGPKLPAALRQEPDLAAAVQGAELLVLALPAQYLRGLLARLDALNLPASVTYLNVAKGIEVGSLKRMGELVEELLGPVRYAVLSGPSHAEEVARGIPTAVVAAARESGLAEQLQQTFMNPQFRVYTSDDVIGVELGGALKNVYALAAGVCDGMAFGDNAKAALMTRGIAEMARLGQELGGRPETFSGLSGIGDLIVTCISRHSRNRHVGQELGRGLTLDAIQAGMGGKVAEGVPTTKSAFDLARRRNIETPIIDQVHAALYQDKDPRQAVTELMTRDAKPERG
ncbi:MAG: glycerol-3-phosphate dehydrogenase [Lentisphaerae bacterium RIFOXYB12_FULL_65_16]|nr:MAG: glycerol-3-phosphate dehydrogenase [Lentisphaerae bacterium RIFOXYA12_64_32]OGV87524.1 MAG: glycerol-3-phosphate dehydrogenase [Lentisphaerae bacterium RIFOXYB12_FULL_65_16]